MKMKMNIKFIKKLFQLTRNSLCGYQLEMSSARLPPVPLAPSGCAAELAVPPVTTGCLYHVLQLQCSGLE